MRGQVSILVRSLETRNGLRRLSNIKKQDKLRAIKIYVIANTKSL